MWLKYTLSGFLVISFFSTRSIAQSYFHTGKIPYGSFPITFHGQLTVDNLYTIPGHTPVGTDSLLSALGGQLPTRPGYTRVHWAAQATLFGIPVGITGMYSTEDNQFRQDLPLFGFDFSADALKKIVDGRIDKQLATLKAQLDGKLSPDLKFPEPRLQQLGQDMIYDPGKLKAKLPDLPDSLTGKVQGLQDRLLEKEVELTGLQAQVDQQKLNLRSKADHLALGKLQDSLNVLKNQKLELAQQLGTITGQLPQEKLRLPSAKADSIWQLKDRAILKEKVEILTELKGLKHPSGYKLGSKLFRLGFIGKGERLLMGVRKFSIGRVSPRFTDWTVSGLPVLGVFSEFMIREQGYVAVTAFSSSQTVPIPQLGSLNPSQGRLPNFPNLNLPRLGNQLYAVAAGWGKKESTHWHLTCAYGQEDSALVQPAAADTTNPALWNYNTPRQNVVVGTDGRWEHKKTGLWLAGEFNISATAANRYRNKLSGSETIRIFTGPVYTNDSTTGDLAARLELGWHINQQTRVSTAYRRVGSGYQAVGAPYIRNDYQQATARVDRQLLNGWLVLGSQATFETNNVSGWRAATTRSLGLENTLTAQVPKWPVLVLKADYWNYAPMGRTADEETQAAQGSMVNANLSAIWQPRLRKARLQLTATAATQQYMAKDPEKDFSSWQVSVASALGLDKGVTLTTGFLGVWSYTAPSNTELYSGQAGIQFRLLEKWEHQATATAAWENLTGERYSLSWEMAYPVLGFLKLKCMAAEYYYPGIAGKQWLTMLGGGATITW